MLSAPSCATCRVGLGEGELTDFGGSWLGQAGVGCCPRGSFPICSAAVLTSLAWPHSPESRGGGGCLWVPELCMDSACLG